MKNTEKILPIILGTDENSYTIARSFHAAFGEKVVVCGAGILLPFYKSKIADIYTAENFSSDGRIFSDLLNSVYEKYREKAEKFMLFGPTEEYLKLLYTNLENLNFTPLLPYPEKELGIALMDKNYFYGRMEECGVEIPRTRVATAENYRDALWEAKLFIKAADYELFNSYDFPQKHKGFLAENAQAAQDYLAAVYSSGFSGEMLVQTYIAGSNRQEYSVNGYRRQDGECVFVQARSILTDQRPMWVGNHLLLTDSDRPDLYPLCQRALESLGYYGFFNFDFKVDAHTDKPYMLELNTRLGRSFYYANLNGVNFIEQAMRDFQGAEMAPIERRPFNWITATRSAVEKMLSGEDLAYFQAPDRYANTGNALDYQVDSNPLRTARIAGHRKKLGEILPAAAQAYTGM